jgi:hypothetical protein
VPNDDDDRAVELLAEEVRRLAEDVARLRDENEGLRARLDRLVPPPLITGSAPAAGPPTTTLGTPGTDPAPDAGRMGRRRLLRDGLVAGAAATAAVGMAGPSAPAAAATGDPLILGSFNTTGFPTTVRTAGGVSFEDGEPQSTRFTGAALQGHHGPSAGGVPGVGVSAHTDDDGYAGLVATGPIAGYFSSSLTQLRLTTTGISTRITPVQDPIAHERGEVVASTNGGELWWCVASGTPGEWRKLSGTSTAGAFHLLPSPVRVYDSRPGTSPSQGPKTRLPAGNVARTIDVSQNDSGVPRGVSPFGGRIAATGVLLNVLLVNATSGGGNLTVWSADRPKPQSNTLVWGGSAGRFSTLAVSAVDTQARVKVDASLSTDVVVDVVGYYR